MVSVSSLVRSCFFKNDPHCLFVFFTVTSFTCISTCLFGMLSAPVPGYQMYIQQVKQLQTQKNVWWNNECTGNKWRQTAGQSLVWFLLSMWKWSSAYKKGLLVLDNTVLLLNSELKLKVGTSTTSLQIFVTSQILMNRTACPAFPVTLKWIIMSF